ncbi:MAG TPA: ATPase domain-containing protein [Candidatus Nanoarchaeia archaeon]|nr:ATPase domain-containing protein [Candidatus Nanoarchaeia archaeon]
MEIQRVSSGIEGLDSAIEGGYPAGTGTLIMGRPGAGKSTFSSHFINEGIRKNEEVMIVLVGQTSDRYFLDMSRFGFDFEKAEKSGKLIVVNQPIIGSSEDISSFLRIIDIADEKKVNRIVIDSFSLLAMQFKLASEKRREIMNVIKKLTELNRTLVLTLEEAEEGGHYLEEFAVDSVISLDTVKAGDRLRRIVKIEKMRRTKITDQHLTYKIDKNGVTVFSKETPEFQKETKSNKVKTGIAGLDQMTAGGFFESAMTLISGGSGTGKSILGMQFIAYGAYNNESCLYVSFEEAKSQLFRNASMFGWNFRDYEDKKLLNIITAYPESANIEEHIDVIKRKIEETSTKRVVIDSISRIEHFFGVDSGNEFVMMLNNIFKKHNVTALYISETYTLIGTTQAISDSNISTYMDNIVMLKYVEIQSTIKRSIILLKSRGSDHDKEIREFDIDKKGVNIKTKFEHAENILSGSARMTVAEKFASAFKV